MQHFLLLLLIAPALIQAFVFVVPSSDIYVYIPAYTWSPGTCMQGIHLETKKEVWRQCINGTGSYFIQFAQPPLKNHIDIVLTIQDQAVYGMFSTNGSILWTNEGAWNAAWIGSLPDLIEVALMSSNGTLVKVADRTGQPFDKYLRLDPNADTVVDLALFCVIQNSAGKYVSCFTGGDFRCTSTCPNFSPRYQASPYFAVGGVNTPLWTWGGSFYSYDLELCDFYFANHTGSTTDFKVFSGKSISNQYYALKTNMTTNHTWIEYGNAEKGARHSWFVSDGFPSKFSIDYKTRFSATAYGGTVAIWQEHKYLDTVQTDYGVPQMHVGCTDTTCYLVMQAVDSHQPPTLYSYKI